MMERKKSLTANISTSSIYLDQPITSKNSPVNKLKLLFRKRDATEMMSTSMSLSRSTSKNHFIPKITCQLQPQLLTEQDDKKSRTTPRHKFRPEAVTIQLNGNSNSNKEKKQIEKTSVFKTPVKNNNRKTNHVVDKKKGIPSSTVSLRKSEDKDVSKERIKAMIKRVGEHMCEVQSQALNLAKSNETALNSLEEKFNKLKLLLKHKQ